MLRRSLFTFILFSATFQMFATDYQKISGQLGLLKNDPIKMLTSIENRITSEPLYLSQAEREQLIQDLTELKSTLCSRPGAGLLMLPILVTIYFGFKSYWHYQEARMWYEYKAPTLFESFVISLLGAQDKALDECGRNLVAFCISLAVSIVTNIEYREKVPDLFIKERCIEKKINALITLLKQ